MARPALRKNTRNGQFRMALPKDIRDFLSTLPPVYRPRGWGATEITLSLGTADSRKMAAEHARIAQEVHERFAKLRAGTVRLSQKEATALAGTVYRGLATGGEDDPGSPRAWQRVRRMNIAAQVGDFGMGSLMIGEVAQRERSVEDRFGAMADATLATKCIITDPESRWRLVEALAEALNDAAAKLEKNARGDYTPDPKAGRFPEWKPEGAREASSGGPKLSLMGLFDRWAKHPEQAGQATTARRYKSVFAAVAEHLRDPDARSVTQADIQGYIEAREHDPVRPLQPRVARDVHKAALSSVYGWAVSKRVVLANPAAGIVIKVPRKVRMRPQHATDEEARAIADASLAIPVGRATSGTFEAAQRWCSLLCLYTGARIGEITQLRKQDVRISAAGASVHLTPEAGAVKGKQAREVPIHDRLVEIGFLDFVRNAPEGPLFYTEGRRRKSDAQTPQSEMTAREVATWARSNGLGDPLLLRPMHALRHRFMSCARRAGIEEQYAEQIAGHARTTQNRRYGEFPIDVLQREIAKLSWQMIEGR